MELKIITGLSGAGKSLFLRVLEDLDYYTVDHLPVEMIGDFLETLAKEERETKKAALAVDIREKAHFHHLFQRLREIEGKVSLEIVFLEAETEVLLKRYRETRRRHPLGNRLRIWDAIEEERQLLKPIRHISHRVIDTTHMSGPHLQKFIIQLYGKDDGPRIMVNVVSFGFKYGVPLDLDFLFDVRFLPNPFYVEAFRNETGLEVSVRDYVLEMPECQTFLDRLGGLFSDVLHDLEEMGRDHLVIGIGCTGGQHRSVAISEALGRRFTEMQYCVTVSHRDIWRAGSKNGKE